MKKINKIILSLFVIMLFFVSSKALAEQTQDKISSQFENQVYLTQYEDGLQNKNFCNMPILEFYINNNQNNINLEECYATITDSDGKYYNYWRKGTEYILKLDLEIKEENFFEIREYYNIELEEEGEYTVKVFDGDDQPIFIDSFNYVKLKEFTQISEIIGDIDEEYFIQLETTTNGSIESYVEGIYVEFDGYYNDEEMKITYNSTSQVITMSFKEPFLGELEIDNGNSTFIPVNIYDKSGNNVFMNDAVDVEFSIQDRHYSTFTVEDKFNNEVDTRVYKLALDEEQWIHFNMLKTDGYIVITDENGIPIEYGNIEQDGWCNFRLPKGNYYVLLRKADSFLPEEFKFVIKKYNNFPLTMHFQDLNDYVKVGALTDEYITIENYNENESYTVKAKDKEGNTLDTIDIKHFFLSEYSGEYGGFADLSVLNDQYLGKIWTIELYRNDTLENCVKVNLVNVSRIDVLGEAVGKVYEEIRIPLELYDENNELINERVIVHVDEPGIHASVFENAPYDNVLCLYAQSEFNGTVRIVYGQGKIEIPVKFEHDKTMRLDRLHHDIRVVSLTHEYFEIDNFNENERYTLKAKDEEGNVITTIDLIDLLFEENADVKRGKVDLSVLNDQYLGEVKIIELYRDDVLENSVNIYWLNINKVEVFGEAKGKVDEEIELIVKFYDEINRLVNDQFIVHIETSEPNSMFIRYSPFKNTLFIHSLKEINDVIKIIYDKGEVEIPIKFAYENTMRFEREYDSKVVSLTYEQIEIDNYNENDKYTLKAKDKEGNVLTSIELKNFYFNEFYNYHVGTVDLSVLNDQYLGEIKTMELYRDDILENSIEINWVNVSRIEILGEAEGEVSEIIKIPIELYDENDNLIDERVIMHLETSEITAWISPYGQYRNALYIHGWKEINGTIRIIYSNGTVEIPVKIIDSNKPIIEELTFESVNGKYIYIPVGSDDIIYIQENGEYKLNLSIKDREGNIIDSSDLLINIYNKNKMFSFNKDEMILSSSNVVNSHNSEVGYLNIYYNGKKIKEIKVKCMKDDLSEDFDSNHDGFFTKVDVQELFSLINKRGEEAGYNEKFDYNKDEVIDIIDMCILAKEVKEVQDYAIEVTLDTSPMFGANITVTNDDSEVFAYRVFKDGEEITSGATKINEVTLVFPKPSVGDVIIVQLFEVNEVLLCEIETTIK